MRLHHLLTRRPGLTNQHRADEFVQKLIAAGFVEHEMTCRACHGKAELKANVENHGVVTVVCPFCTDGKELARIAMLPSVVKPVAPHTGDINEATRDPS